jgi:hypothetical protein
MVIIRPNCIKKAILETGRRKLLTEECLLLQKEGIILYRIQNLRYRIIKNKKALLKQCLANKSLLVKWYHPLRRLHLQNRHRHLRPMHLQ